MKEIILLTKILLKSSTSDGKKDNEKKSKSFGRILFFVLVYGYIIVFMAYISNSIITILLEAKKEEVFLNFAFTILLGLSVLQIIIASLNILYFSKDLDVLMPLPLTPIKIVVAKLNCLVISQYIISTLLVFPGLIVYGNLLRLGINYYIVVALSLLLFPLIPVAITAFIVTIIMKFTKIIKNKETVQYLTVLLTIVLIILLQFSIGATNDTVVQDVLNNLNQTNKLIQNVPRIFPTIDLIVNAIQNHNSFEGFLNLCLLFIISIVIYYIFAIVISKLYVKTALSLTSGKSKKVKKIDLTKNIKISNNLIAYVKKEFKLLVRTPVFLMQCVLPSIIFPIIIAVPAFMGVQDTGVNMELLQNDFSNIINSSFGFMCFMISILVFFLFNNTSITAVSRDGQNSVFMKYIPISLDTQMIYKIIPGILLNIIPIVYTIIFGIICIPKIQINTVFYIIIVSMLINILNNILMIIVDLKNPKLKWITEQAVVKQNFNMFFGMLFIAIEAVIILILGTYIKDLNYLVITLIIMLVTMILIIKNYINRNKEKIFSKII